MATIVQMVANDIGVTLLPGMAVSAGIVGNAPLTVRSFEQPNVTRKSGSCGAKDARVEFLHLGYLMAGLIKQAVVPFRPCLCVRPYAESESPTVGLTIRCRLGAVAAESGAECHCRSSRAALFV